jgi:hypothetical protein
VKCLCSFRDFTSSSKYIVSIAYHLTLDLRFSHFYRSLNIANNYSMRWPVPENQSVLSFEQDIRMSYFASKCHKNCKNGIRMKLWFFLAGDLEVFSIIARRICYFINSFCKSPAFQLRYIEIICNIRLQVPCLNGPRRNS